MPEYYIGLMSGTSLDGIDAALVEFSNDQIRLIDFHYQAFTPELKQKLQAISRPDQAILLSDYGYLDSLLGHLFAETVQTLLNQADFPANTIKAIGSHGQTVFHAPTGDFGFSLQIGDPNRIAELTGITTISDFRRRDIAVGGQGAPLVPAFHQAVFTDPKQTRTIVNIGGIANVTLLNESDILGFDTGPGNTLLDYWCQLQTGSAFDQDGNWSATGQVNPLLLNAFKADSYFQLPPPKSTGKEYFSASWLQQILQDFSDIAAEDIQATLVQLTADSITDAIKQHAPQTALTLVCGGGVHNRLLMQKLNENLAMSVTSTAEYGIHPDHVEAMAFAWLARQTLNDLPGNLTSVTGAKQQVILGGIYPGHPKHQ